MASSATLGLNGHHPDWGIETPSTRMPRMLIPGLNGHHPDWGIETSVGWGWASQS